MKPPSNTTLGWAIASGLAILLLIQALSIQHREHRAEIKRFEGKIADYEDYIVFLSEAYDSLLVEEVELIERHNEEILSIDTLSIDSLRGYFSNRYGFLNVLYSDSTEVDSTGY